MKRVIRVFISIIYVGFLALCCFSAPMRANGVAAPIVGVGKVNFAAGSFPVDTVELSVVLQEGESALLDQFTGLQRADLSGSTCYEEIMQWAAAHPQVELRYTVTMPDGTSPDNSAQSIDLSALDSQGLAQAAELLKYLPALSAVELGSQSESRALTGADINAVRAACPEAEISYSFALLGREFSLNSESADLTGLGKQDIGAAADMLSSMPKLTYVNLGSQEGVAFDWEDIGALQAACPEVDFDYRFSLWGQSISLLDETLDFNHITMDDEGAAVRAILPYMKSCSRLDMDFCGVSNSSMEAIRNDFPNIKVIWRIWFGTTYSVRTDVEKILASKPSKGGVLDNSQVAVLKYCTDVKYLDLGHNEAITDLSFAYGMPNLEVLVIAMNPLTDITPLASCPKLEYIELNSTGVTDLSPLAGLTQLRHLNIGNCSNVTDISPLYGLTELERLWIGSITPVPADQVAAMQAAAPDCEINTEVYDPVAGNWRVTGYTERSLQLYAETGWLKDVLHPRYELLRQQFGYDTEEYAFYWNDPLY